MSPLFSRLFLSLGLLTSQAIGQVYTPSGSSEPSLPPSAPPSSSKSNSSSGGNTSSNNSLFGNDFPFLNPRDESISFGGKTWPLGDTRLFAARYDKYLNEPEDEHAFSLRYRKLLRSILDKLSPRNQEAPVEKLRQVLPMLDEATKFPGDANLCRTIINVIQTAYLSKSSNTDKLREIRDIDKALDKYIIELNRFESIEEAKKKSLTNRAASKDAPPPPKERTAAEFSRYKNIVKKIAELEGKKKLLEAQIPIGIVQAKINFQAFLVQMLLQRRFEHAIIGSYTYNIVFSDGDNKLKLEKGSDAAKLFGETVGMPPTVSSIESAANEAIQDTIRAVESVKGLLRDGNLTAASKRLCEAYFIGEFLEPIRVFPLKEKHAIAQYTRDVYSLISAGENRDFTRALELIDSLKKQAKDFDTSKALPAITAATQASDLHLMNAQQALMIKDSETAKSEIKLAMEMWPMNPRLAEIGKTFASGSELVTAKTDFERLIREENFRQIFKDQYRFAPAIRGDQKLEDAFRQIIQNIMKIEAAIGKAKEFTAMGQPYAAWEELRKMRDQKVFSQDPDLGNEIANLSTQVSDLANALETAQSLENNQEIGSALAWYVKARAIYPRSKYAKEAIERLLPQAFPLPTPSAS